MSSHFCSFIEHKFGYYDEIIKNSMKLIQSISLYARNCLSDSEIQRNMNISENSIFNNRRKQVLNHLEIHQLNILKIFGSWIPTFESYNELIDAHKSENLNCILKTNDKEETNLEKIEKIDQLETEVMINSWKMPIWLLAIFYWTNEYMKKTNNDATLSLLFNENCIVPIGWFKAIFNNIQIQQIDPLTPVDWWVWMEWENQNEDTISSVLTQSQLNYWVMLNEGRYDEIMDLYQSQKRIDFKLELL